MIISDNRTTFKGASRTTKQIMKEPEVQDYLMDKRFEWMFNIE